MFKGALDKSTTTYLNIPFTRWMEERGITWEDIKGRTDDLQSASIFPKVTSVEDLGILVRWMTSEPQLEEGKNVGSKQRKFLPTKSRQAPTSSVFMNSAMLSVKRTGKDWRLIMKKAYSINLTYWMPQTNLYVSIWILPMSCKKMPHPCYGYTTGCFAHAS